jgi:hypothetical protein
MCMLCCFAARAVSSGQFVATLRREWASDFAGFSFAGSADAVALLVSQPGLVALEQQRPFEVDWWGTEPEPAPPPPLLSDSGDTQGARRALQGGAPWHLDRLDADPASNTTLDGAFVRTGGFDGTGIVVYVMDTGVAPHVDFGGRVVAGPNFALDGRESDNSCLGHGTHVRGAPHPPPFPRSRAPFPVGSSRGREARRLLRAALLALRVGCAGLAFLLPNPPPPVWGSQTTDHPCVFVCGPLACVVWGRCSAPALWAATRTVWPPASPS